MSEAEARKTLVKKLRPLDAQPIEVKGRAGVPDVEHIYGWIEMKFKPKWPVRNPSTTVIKWPHKLEVPQQRWLERRAQMRGGAAVLCGKVDRDWFFWNCATFDLNLFDHQTKSEMIASADKYYHIRLNHKDLIPWLISLHPSQ